MTLRRVRFGLLAILVVGCRATTDSRMPDDEDSGVNEGLTDAGMDGGDEDGGDEGVEEAGHDGDDAASDAGDGGADADACISSLLERCHLCNPTVCPPGQRFEIYNCRCIVPGDCRNGWDLCDTSKVCDRQGRCVQCSAEDPFHCGDAGRCDFEAGVCVHD